MAPNEHHLSLTSERLTFTIIVADVIGKFFVINIVISKIVILITTTVITNI